MKPLYVFLIIFIILLICFLVVSLYFKYRPPYCGDQINKDKFLCHSKDENTCNPTNEVQYYHDIETFIEYLLSLYRAQSQYVPITDSAPKIIQGLFFYATPELLRIMPTDFGQNSLSPYGFASFFTAYPTCISNIETFCASMFPSNENSFDNPQQQGQRRCQLFLEAMQRINARNNISCPFPLRDDSTDLFIGDQKVFNQFGLLGSTSMKENQGIMVNICLHMDPTILADESLCADKCCCAENTESVPTCANDKSNLQFLDLSYWSFALYKMESMNREDICYPNYQVNAASLCPVLNMYTAVSEAFRQNKKKLKPTGDTYHFIILINFNKETDDQMRNYVSDAEQTQLSFKGLDFVYTMKIPNSEGSLPLSDNLPNPNKLGKSSKYFDPKTDRFGFISRFVEKDEIGPDYTSLSDFISNPDNQSIKVQLFEFPDVNSGENTNLTPWDYQPFPEKLSAPVNEQVVYSDDMTRLKKKLLKPLQEKFYTIKKLQTRYDLVNITAPLYPSILNGKNPYLAGFQAIQMAGNMQGDNPDAQYRLQAGECISDDDVLITVTLNHQNIGNCYYNSLNITDGYQAYGYYGYNPGKQNRFIVFITGRSPEKLKQVEKNLTKVVDSFGETEIMFKTIITDKTQLFAIPKCHPVLTIERIYLNSVYQSSDDPRLIYSVGDTIDKLISRPDDLTDDEILSLSNVTGPSLNNFIPPAFYKVNLNERAVIVTFISIIIFVFAIIFFAYYLRKFRLRRKNK